MPPCTRPPRVYTALSAPPAPISRLSKEDIDPCTRTSMDGRIALHETHTGAIPGCTCFGRTSRPAPGRTADSNAPKFRILRLETNRGSDRTLETPKTAGRDPAELLPEKTETVPMHAPSEPTQMWTTRTRRRICDSSLFFSHHLLGRSIHSTAFNFRTITSIVFNAD